MIEGLNWINMVPDRGNRQDVENMIIKITA